MGTRTSSRAVTKPIWGSEKQTGIRSTRHLETGDLEPEIAKMLRLFNVRYVLSIMSPCARPHYGASDGLPKAWRSTRSAIRSREPSWWERRCTRRATQKCCACSRAPEFDADEAGRRRSWPVFACRRTQVRRRTSRSSIGGTPELTLHALLARPGLLVVSEGYYPGWQAEVDGVAAPIVPTNGMMRGVVLPAGEHQIVFRFRSRAIAAGFLAVGCSPSS